MQCALVEQNQSIATRGAWPLVAAGTVRRTEWVILAFLIYAAGVACILPVAEPVRYRIGLLNVAAILVYGLLIQGNVLRPSLAFSVVRDWLPLAMILLAYREMGWLALPHHGHLLESHWVVWDRLLLRGGGKAAIEAFGPVLPAILEIAYALVYALAPFSLAALYLYGRRGSAERFLFIFAVGVLLCYAQFPLWPSEPPRVVFFPDDFPAYDTVFRRFNLWMLGNYGIHTSVFPSAHVAGAFATAFGMRQAMPERKWVYRFLYVAAVLIAVATVYGRYHYLADATAGFLMAALALASGRRREVGPAFTAETPHRGASTFMETESLAAGRAGDLTAETRRTRSKRGERTEEAEFSQETPRRTEKARRKRQKRSRHPRIFEGDAKARRDAEKKTREISPRFLRASASPR